MQHSRQYKRILAYILAFLLLVSYSFSTNYVVVHAETNSITVTTPNSSDTQQFSTVQQAINWCISDTDTSNFEYTINLNGSSITEKLNITFDANQTHHKKIDLYNGTLNLDSTHTITIVDNTTFQPSNDKVDVRFNNISFNVSSSNVISITGLQKKYCYVKFSGFGATNPITDNRTTNKGYIITATNTTLDLYNTRLNATNSGGILSTTDSDCEFNRFIVNSNVNDYSSDELFEFIGDTVISTINVKDSDVTGSNIFYICSKNTGNVILNLTDTDITNSYTTFMFSKPDATNEKNPTVNYISGNFTTVLGSSDARDTSWDGSTNINSSNTYGSILNVGKDVKINDTKSPLYIRIYSENTHNTVWTISSPSAIHGKVMAGKNEKLILDGAFIDYNGSWYTYYGGPRFYVTENGAIVNDKDGYVSVYPEDNNYTAPFEVYVNIKKGNTVIRKRFYGPLQSKLYDYMNGMTIGDTIGFLTEYRTNNYTIDLPKEDDRVWLNTNNEVVKGVTANMINNCEDYDNGYVLTLAECTHTNTEIRNKVNPTCTETGYSGDTYCADCEKKLQTGHTNEALGHTWSDWNITEENTCSKVGSKYRTCSVCKEVETVEIAKDNKKHSLTPVSKVDATCTENGSDAHYTCEYCGKLFTDSQGTTETTATDLIIQAKGHTPSEPVNSNVVEPTCTTKGSYTETITCSECGETISVTNKQSDALGHDWGEWTTINPATEDSAGLEVRICKRDASHTENRIIPQLTHVHTGTLVPATSATCTESGNNAYYECSGCHKLFTDVNCTIETDLDAVTVSALGHQLTHHDAVPAKFENGNIAYDSCDRCNKVFLSDGTEATLNDVVVAVPTYENIEVISDLTNPQPYIVTLTFTKNDNPIFEYSNEGIVKADVTNTEIIASDNGMTYKKTITISALRAGETTVLIESPWNGNVIVGYNCTSTVNEHNHSYVRHTRTEATCTEDGNKEYWECSQCHKCFNDDLGTTEIDKNDMILPKTGHSFDTLVEATNPTCTKEGNVAYYECENCHKYFDTDKTTELATVSIPKTKHTLVHIPAKEPTETESGNIEYWQCSVCDTMFGDGVGENEVSISDVIINTLNPSCKHTHTKVVDAIDATCTEYGYTGRTVCEDCNTTISSGDMIEPLGHNIEQVKAKSATLTANGYKAHYKCTRCYTLYTDAEGKNTTTMEALQTAKLININKATISGINTSYNYTNALIKPTVKVVYNKKTLKLNTDYTVSYAKNKNVGTATVTIKGKGLYGGSVNKTFKIVYPTIKARAYTQNKWQSWASISSVNKVMTIGTGKLLQGYQMKLTNNSGYINYKAYVQKTGWQAVKSTKTSAISGTKTSKRVEMVSFTPKGNMATLYDVYYRAYVSGKGWTNWAKNGSAVGSKGLSKAITKVQIKYVKKGTKVTVGNGKAIFTK